MRRNQILVIRGGAIGDFILTLPALQALRRQFPQTRLEVLGYPHIAQLAVAGGWAHAVRSIEARALAGFFARGGALDPALQDYFDSFAIILSYLYDPDGIFQENVARGSKAQFIAGPHRPDDTAGLHATAVFLKPLERLAIFGAETVPLLSVEFDARLRGAEKNESEKISSRGISGWLAVHPGSGSERKNWPEPLWEQLLRGLTEQTGWRVLVVGGEAEGDRLERLTQPLPSGRVRVARSQPLPDLARQLSACRAFVGHDSGISHLAAALGVPSLVLWGETVEAVWRPQGDHVTVLRSPQGLPSITVAEVMEWLRGQDAPH